jgi:transposase
MEEQMRKALNPREIAKAHLISLMQAGYPWQKAAAMAGLHISRSTAYRLFQAIQTRGDAAILDGRHGHPAKLRETVLQWLVTTCRANLQMPSRQVQTALQERFGIHVSISHLNRVRAQLGLGNHVGRSKKNSKRSLLLLDLSGRKAPVLCSSSPLRMRHVC